MGKNIVSRETVINVLMLKKQEIGGNDTCIKK